MPIFYYGRSEPKQLVPYGFAGHAELLESVALHPDLLKSDEEPNLVVVERNVQLKGIGPFDLLLVDADGGLVITNIKLAAEQDSRRQIFAQVFELIATLEDMEIAEFDDLLNGALTKALKAFTPDRNDDYEFEKVWNYCKSALRNGQIRMAMVTDEASENLVKAFTFIKERSDIDVRLLALQRYALGENEGILIPKFKVVSAIRSAQAREAAPAEPRPEFSEVLNAYARIALEGFEPQGQAARYRTLRPHWWPRGIHYEFYDYGGEVGVEIHLESDAVKPLAEVLRSFESEFVTFFPAAMVSWDDQWSNNRGRLRVLISPSASPLDVVGAMKLMIKQTWAPINDTLERYGLIEAATATVPTETEPAAEAPVQPEPVAEETIVAETIPEQPAPRPIAKPQFEANLFNSDILEKFQTFDFNSIPTSTDKVTPSAPLNPAWESGAVERPTSAETDAESFGFFEAPLPEQKDLAVPETDLSREPVDSRSIAAVEPLPNVAETFLETSFEPELENVQANEDHSITTMKVESGPVLETAFGATADYPATVEPDPVDVVRESESEVNLDRGLALDDSSQPELQKTIRFGEQTIVLDLERLKKSVAGEVSPTATVEEAPLPENLKVETESDTTESDPFSNLNIGLTMDPLKFENGFEPVEPSKPVVDLTRQKVITLGNQSIILDLDRIKNSGPSDPGFSTTGMPQPHDESTLEETAETLKTPSEPLRQKVITLGNQSIVLDLDRIKNPLSWDSESPKAETGVTEDEKPTEPVMGQPEAAEVVTVATETANELPDKPFFQFDPVAKFHTEVHRTNSKADEPPIQGPDDLPQVEKPVKIPALELTENGRNETTRAATMPGFVEVIDENGRSSLINPLKMNGIGSGVRLPQIDLGGGSVRNEQSPTVVHDPTPKTMTPNPFDTFAEPEGMGNSPESQLRRGSRHLEELLKKLDNI